MCFVFVSIKQLMIDAITGMQEICILKDGTCPCNIKCSKMSLNPFYVFKAVDVLAIQSEITVYDLYTNYWAVKYLNDGKYQIKIIKKTLAVNRN